MTAFDPSSPQPVLVPGDARPVAGAPAVRRTAAAAHRIPLAGTVWSVWRDVALRSAGFPADLVFAICDEPLAHSADLAAADLAAAELAAAGPVRRAAGSKRPGGGRRPDPASPAYAAAFAAAAGRLPAAIAAINADQAFQEAVTWQNPRLAQRLRDAGGGGTRRAKERERELVVASYLQRYCLKNDTIGFFGPVGWATVSPGTAGLAVTPGEQLIARRRTYFEVWAIDKVAAVIAGPGRTLGWLVPRRTRSAFLAGNVLHRPHRQPVVLTDAELRILRACTGRATISEILASAGRASAGLASADGADARALLARLAELGALRLDLEGPADAWPERLLRDQLTQIADPAARAAAVEPLDRIIEARDMVAASAGGPARLSTALARLAETFEQVTGSPATRRPGEPYAGRTLVYEDTVRDVRVELGTAVTGALARPLGLVLDSARWLINEVTARYRVLFGQLIDRELARSGGAPVPLLRLLTVASPYLAIHQGRAPNEIVAASVAELQRRWQELLGPPPSGGRHQLSADAIAARAAGLFPGQQVRWSGARQHSPDIMIAAASADEVLRGSFLLVLGELHLATNTLESRALVEQHPDPARLIAAEQADHGPRRIISIPAKDFVTVTSRASPPSAVLGPGQVYWTAAVADSLDPPEPATIIPAAALTVTRRGGDLVVQVMPSGPRLAAAGTPAVMPGTELDFFEVIGDLMSGIATAAFHPVAAAPHRPRITIDRLVLSREQWVFDVADSAWAFAPDEDERYYLARRWRQRHQLPERVFVRVPVEVKPMAADFRSIVLVNLFAKHVRQTKAAGHQEYTVSEMLPGPGQLWLADRAGRRYSSELRFVAFDSLAGQ